MPDALHDEEKRLVETDFCEGPYCSPRYEMGEHGKVKQTGVICPLDCTLCGIPGEDWD